MTQFNKGLSFGFIVIAPEHNFGRIKSTIRSIKNRYKENIPIICVVGDDTTAPELKEIKTLCPSFKGKGTITSLLNAGLLKGHEGWNIFAMEGTTVRQGLDQKYSRWIKDEKDVLYPIVVDYNQEGVPIKIYNNFSECTLNGLCIHRKTFKEIGNFSENPLEISKKFWALGAIEIGVQFKAILGARFC
jgi:hypothetical protein